MVRRCSWSRLAGRLGGRGAARNSPQGTGPSPEAATLNSSDLVLMLVGAPSDQPEHSGRVHSMLRLEKFLFLADREHQVQHGAEDAFGFAIGEYGPCSKDVHEAALLLDAIELLWQTGELDDHSVDDLEDFEAGLPAELGVERRFTLTPEGEAGDRGAGFGALPDLGSDEPNQERLRPLAARPTAAPHLHRVPRVYEGRGPDDLRPGCERPRGQRHMSW